MDWEEGKLKLILDADKRRNVIPNEVRNLGFEILRFAQNDSNAVICENLRPNLPCEFQ